MTIDTEKLRGAVTAAWAKTKTSNAGSISLDRIYVDATPGALGAYDKSGSALKARSRLGFDSKTYDLIADHRRAQRISPSDIGRLNELGQMQLHTLTQRLAANGSKLGLDSGDDSQLTKALLERYGSDPARLWRVGSHVPAFLRTISRAAALADQGQGGIGADSMTGVFIGSELTLQLPELVEIEKRKPSARDFFPIKFLNTPGAKDYEFRKLDRKARAEHTATFEGKAPRVTFTSEPIKRPLIWAWSGLSFSWLDVEEWKLARANGSPIPEIVGLQSETAREALLDLESIDLFFGSGSGPAAVLGLLSQSGGASAQGIPQPTAIANFADAADAEEAVQALLTGVRAIKQARYRGDIVIALGTRDFIYITSNTYDANDTVGTSIYDVALARGKALGLSAIVELPELGYEAEVATYLADIGYKAPLTTTYAGGIGGKAVMLTAVRDPNYHRGIVGQDLMALPPDKTSTSTSIAYVAQNGGLEVKQPLSMHLQIVNDPT